MGKSTISMVMFNSYVKLPEGYPVSFGPTQKPIPGARFRHLHRLHQRPATLGPQPRTEAVLHWNGAGGGIHGVGTCRWGSWGNSPRKNPGFIDIKMRSLHDLNNKKQTMKSWWLILLFGSYWGVMVGDIYIYIYIYIKGLRPLPPTPGHIFCGAWASELDILDNFCELSELSVFQPRRLTNGAFATPKQQGPEGRTGPAGHGPQFLTLLSEPTRKLALWAVCLPAAKAHKRRLRHTETAGPWRTDRACGPRPPVPNVAFWTDKKTSSLSCLSSSREGSQTAPSPHRNSRALKDGPGLRATAPSA